MFSRPGMGHSRKDTPVEVPEIVRFLKDLRCFVDFHNMGTTQDTVYLTQQLLDELIDVLNRPNRFKPEGGSDFKPVGRVEYTKRKYNSGSSTSSNWTPELL